MIEPGRAAISRSERRKARTTAAILDAAERHFLERGFQNARVDEIAEEADVAVGSVYNHFGSKEALYRAALDRALELFEGYMEEEPAPEGSALEQLLDIAGRVARFGRERPGHLRMLVLPQPREAQEALTDPLERVRKAMVAQERRTAALIEAAVRRGDARPLDSRRAAAFLWSAWTGTLVVGERGDRELRAVLEAGLRVMLGGIASDRARESDEAVRALLESARPASAPPEESQAPGALTRAPVLGSLRSDLPDLALWTAELTARSGPSPNSLQRRLAQLGSRITGAEAEGSRRESTPWAYRVLARQLGAEDGGALSTPERLALRPAEEEPPTSSGLPEDALVAAALETGVPLLAFDAGMLNGGLALRAARAGESLAGEELAEGRVVIADLDRPVAALLGPRAPDAEVTPRTRRIALAAIQAKGIPTLAVEEALWTAIEIMREGR